MKESRYIELLNLYVDHQLTPAEATELESEVQSNPGRRRIYGQYCRMQKACALLFEAERSLAPKTAAAVVAFDSYGRLPSESQSFWRNGGLRVAGLAAALACAGIFGVRFLTSSPALDQGVASSSSVASVEQVVASSSPARTVVVASALPAAVAPVVETASIRVPASVRSQFQSVLVGTTLVLSRLSDADSASPSGVDLAWLNEVKLPSVRTLPEEDLAFEARPSLKQPETRGVYRSRQPFQGNAEMISFQFQR